MKNTMYECLPVERALPGDADAIFGLYRSLVGSPFCTWDDEYPSPAIVSHDLEAYEVFVIRDGEKTAAALVSAVDESLDQLAPWYADVRRWKLLTRIGISTEYQGKGLARRLVAHAIKQARSEGFDGVRMLVSPHNLPAQRAYASFGFDICGEADHFGEHWLCYQLRL